MAIEPWFDTERPADLTGLEILKSAAILDATPVRVIEVDGKLLVMTENAIYAEVEEP